MTTHNTNANCSSIAAKFRRIVQRFQASSPPSTGGTPAVAGPAMYGALPYRPTGVDHVQGYTIVRFSDGDSVHLRGHFPQSKAFERAVEIRKAEQRGKFPAKYGRWVTMGGGGEGSGSRVFLEKDGTISAGPAALTGKKIGDLKKEYRKAKKEKQKKIEAKRKAKEKRIESSKPQTLLQAVRQFGGLNGRKLGFGERINIREDLTQNGLMAALQSSSKGAGAHDLEEMADILERNGLWFAPPGENKSDALLQALKANEMVSGGSDDYAEKQYADYLLQEDNEYDESGYDGGDDSFDFGNQDPKFMTAKEALRKGIKYQDWYQAVEDAFKNEEIDEDHPAWQSVKDVDYRDFAGLKHMGKPVFVYNNSNKPMFGIVKGTSFSNVKGNPSVTIELPDGYMATHSADNVVSLDKWIAQREADGKHVPEDARGFLQQNDSKQLASRYSRLFSTMVRAISASNPAKYGRWITIGGSKEEGEDGKTKGRGGARVYIEDDGTITAGPGKLEGKKIGELDKNVAGTAKDKRKENEPPGKKGKGKKGKSEKKADGKGYAGWMQNPEPAKPEAEEKEERDPAANTERVKTYTSEEYRKLHGDPGAAPQTSLDKIIGSKPHPIDSQPTSIAQQAERQSSDDFAKGINPFSKEQYDDYRPILERNVNNEIVPRRKAMQFGYLADKLSPDARKAMAKRLEEIAPDAVDYIKEDPGVLPIGLRSIFKDMEKEATPAPARSEVGEGAGAQSAPQEPTQEQPKEATKPPEKAPKPPKADLHNALLQEGRRLYVQGDTYPIRQKLRDAGFTWDADKRQWYIGSQKKDDANKIMTRLFGESQRQQWEDVTKSTLQPQQPGDVNQPSKPAATAATAALPSTLREENGRLYVQGSNTYDYREKLKAAGFRWDGDRKKWYIDARHKNHAIETVSGMKKLDQAKTPSEDVTRAKSTGQGSSSSSGSRFGRHENPSTPEEIKQSASKWAEKLGRTLVAGSEPKRWTASGLGKGDDGAENGTIRERNGKYYMQIGRTPRQYYSQEMLEDIDEFNMKPGGAYEWIGVEVEPNEAERAKRATIESEKSRKAAFEDAKKKAIHKDLAKPESRASWGDFGGAGWKETPEEFKDRTGMVKIPTGSTNSDLYTDGDRLISGNHAYDMGSNYFGTTDKEAIREVLRHAPSTKEIDELRAKLGIEPAKYSRSRSSTPLRSRLFRTISRVLAE